MVNKQTRFGVQEERNAIGLATEKRGGMREKAANVSIYIVKEGKVREGSGRSREV